MKCVGQQQRGLTAWRTGVSGDLLWATDRRHAGLVLTNFRALKTLTGSVIYQEFILKKKKKLATSYGNEVSQILYICMYNMYV